MVFLALECIVHQSLIRLPQILAGKLGDVLSMLGCLSNFLPIPLLS